jgi:hypothetical protein
MEHIAYCDAKEKELQWLLEGSKTMLVRGAAGRKLPHGRVCKGDIVYLVENDSSGYVRAKGIVSDVFHSEKLSKEESKEIIDKNMDKLKLTKNQINRWSGKRYLCLISLEAVALIEPFAFERTKNMDDWLLVKDMTARVTQKA